MARRLGKPLMPWQQYVADVATEIDPDTGRFAYDEIGLTVPRQSGKSTLILAKATHRCTATGFFGGRQRVVYTAQTRNKAREKWEEDYAGDLKASKTFGPMIDPHFGNGNEHIRFRNRSRFGIEANTEKAGHGSTLDEAFIDEAFAQPDGRLEQAFRPAMITRHNKQLWWVSTAGWEDASPFLEPKVRTGREHVEMGLRGGLAYFEWSAPDDADPEDRDVWWRCMPALGYTITEDAIAAELRAMADNINDFRRAYLNQWVPRKVADDEVAVIDLAHWSGLADTETPRPNPVAFAVEVSEDRKWATIALAGWRGDGLRQLQIVQTGRGTAWVPERMVELREKWRPVALCVNPAGPAGSLVPEFTRRRMKVTLITGRDVTQASAGMLDAITDSTVRHSGQITLNMAVEAAAKRRSGDAWKWASRDPHIDVAPLQAASYALHGLTSKPRTPKGSRERRAVVL